MLTGPTPSMGMTTRCRTWERLIHWASCLSRPTPPQASARRVCCCVGFVREFLLFLFLGSSYIERYNLYMKVYFGIIWLLFDSILLSLSLCFVRSPLVHTQTRLSGMGRGCCRCRAPCTWPSRRRRAAARPWRTSSYDAIRIRICICIVCLFSFPIN
jgi:hypothetical protein